MATLGEAYRRGADVQIKVSGGKGDGGESAVDTVRRLGLYGVLPADSDATVLTKLASAGIAASTNAAPGQFIVRAAGSDPIFVGSAGTGADAGMRTDLAGPTGADFWGFRFYPSLPVVPGGTVLATLPFEPEMGGATPGVAGNIASFNSYLLARREMETARRTGKPVKPFDVYEEKPKVSMVTDVMQATGSVPFNGFPAAVRHENYDYIFYRVGVSHTENVPITNTAALMVAKKRAGTDKIISRTELFRQNTYDPRDPNVLRDDYGNAILVAGKFKVVLFYWINAYALGAGSLEVRVYDFDPATLALSNPVTVPGVDAVKSDVRQLADGSYAFVGYTMDNQAYLVTTTDWAVFNRELIGPGNETALIQTQDWTLHAITRVEENYRVDGTYHYQKPTGQAWRVHGLIPYKLNAPTLAKIADYYSEDNKSEGYYLFARDKTERQSYASPQVPVSDLVVFRSRNNDGKSITSFAQRRVLIGNILANVGSGGDSNYCSVITTPASREVEIYTYGEMNTANYMTGTPTIVVPVFSIRGMLDQSAILNLRKPTRRNPIANSNLLQGGSCLILTGTPAIIVDPDSGRNILRFDGPITGGALFLVDAEPGDTVFLKLRMRVLRAAVATTGAHLQARIYDRAVSTGVTIRAENILLRPDRWKGDWFTYIGRPIIVPPSGQFMIYLATQNGSPDGLTDISHLELSDDYTINLNPGPLFTSLTPQGKALNFPIAAGGTAARPLTRYSGNIWGAIGVPRLTGTLPFPAKATGDILLQPGIGRGANGVICQPIGTNVLADGSVEITWQAIAGEAGNPTSPITADLAVTITSK